MRYAPRAILARHAICRRASAQLPRVEMPREERHMPSNTFRAMPVLPLRFTLRGAIDVTRLFSRQALQMAAADARDRCRCAAIRARRRRCRDADAATLDTLMPPCHFAPITLMLSSLR